VVGFYWSEKQLISPILFGEEVLTITSGQGHLETRGGEEDEA